GRPCIFVSTSDFPSNVRSGMKSMGLDVKGYEQSGLLTFVDGYSAEAGQESTEKFSVPSIGDLTTLGMKISSSLLPQRSKGTSLYFDSLVPLASKTKPESIEDEIFMPRDRKSTRLNSSHVATSYAVFCLKK